jgi:phosphatidate cytidylyltransferase
MHLKRWLTGIIALPVLIYIIGFCPRWIFYLLLYLANLAGLIEFYRITTPDLHKIGKWAGHLLSLLLFLSIYKGKIYFLPAIIVLWAFVPMTLFMLIPQRRQSTEDLGKALLGPVYVSLPLGMLMIMDRYPQGNMWIFFLLCVIFAGDTGAYYFGKLFGRHKLYESISPKKTWEGAIGGLLCSIIAAFWFLRILLIHQVDLGIITLVIVLSVTGQIGDLAESMLKRKSGIKDSSHLLPGHGGILDRIDSLLFAIPFLYMYLHFCIV